MKIFYCSDGKPADQSRGFIRSVNFVDKRNVLVGVELAGPCVDAGWYFLDESGSRLNDFDVEEFYFVGIKDVRVEDGGRDKYHSRRYRFRVRFPIKSASGKRATLVLENCHNGYYTYGIFLKKGNDAFRKITI